MSFFQFPETMDETQRALYLPDAPDLSRRLVELADADAVELEKAEERDACHEREGAIQTEKGTAEGRDRLLDELAHKKIELDELEEQHEAMDCLQRKIDTAEKALHQVQPKRESLARKESEEEKAAQKLEVQKGSLESQRDQETKAVMEIGGELDSLEGIDARFVAPDSAYDQGGKNTAALKAIQGGVNTAFQNENVFGREQKKLSELASAASELEQRHHDLYQRFLAGQAGPLAEELRQNVAENGSAICPVCRSELRAGQEHTFAELPKETPTKAEVDGAKEAFEAQEKLRNEQDKKAGKLEASIKGEKDRILQDVKLLLPICESWECLTAAGYLADELDRFQQEENAKKSDRDCAAEKQKRSMALKKQKLKKGALLNKLRTDISDVEQKLDKIRTSVNTLETEFKGLREQLKYSDQADAQAEIDKKMAERSRMQDQVKEHKTALAHAKENRDITSGSLKGKEDDLPGLEWEVAGAERALRTALAQNGFDTLAVGQALLPLEGADGETWLKDQRGELERYRSDCEHTSGAYAAARDAYIRLDKLAENHRSTAKQIACASQALADSEGAWGRLNRLANLAVGVSGERGVMSFGWYVMGTVFREVLEMANLRLNVMSGGKYELIHQLSAGRQNAKAGLDVEVLDMATEKQRSSDSLSGGESFLVSLALALGLSDVVQHHAGGKKLDALFIDEGFGSLDSAALDTAMEVLNQLTQGNCLVGLISHASRLEESIPQKIRISFFYNFVIAQVKSNKPV